MKKLLIYFFILTQNLLSAQENLSGGGQDRYSFVIGDTAYIHTQSGKFLKFDGKDFKEIAEIPPPILQSDNYSEPRQMLSTIKMGYICPSKLSIPILQYDPKFDNWKKIPHSPSEPESPNLTTSPNRSFYFILEDSLLCAFQFSHVSNDFFSKYYNLWVLDSTNNWILKKKDIVNPPTPSGSGNSFTYNNRVYWGYYYYFDNLTNKTVQFNNSNYTGGNFVFREGSKSYFTSYDSKEFWVYDVITNTKIKRANFNRGFPRRVEGFYLKDKGYVASTYPNGAPAKILSSYDIVQDIWECNLGNPVNDFDLKATNSSITVGNKSVNNIYFHPQWSLNDTVKNQFNNVFNPLFNSLVRGTCRICQINYNECLDKVDTICKTVQVGVCKPNASLCPDFNFEVQGRVVGFFNRSRGAISYNWDFGDNKTSTEVSPTHEYSDAGEYIVRLIATSVDNINDTVLRRVKVRGLNRISPDRGGIGSYVTVTLTGLGFDTNSRVSLRSITGQIINPEELKVNSISKATAVFRISFSTQAELYDVIALLGGISDTIKAGFEIQTSEKPIFNVSLEGPSRIRTGVKRRFSIVVKNLSNTDAFMVPLSLTEIPAIADVKLLTPVSYELPASLASSQRVQELFASPNIELLKNPIKYDSATNKKFFFIFLPLVQAGSTVNIDFEILIPVLGLANPNLSFTLDYDIFPPLFENNQRTILSIQRANNLQVRNVNCNPIDVFIECTDLIPFKASLDCSVDLHKLLFKSLIYNPSGEKKSVKDIVTEIAVTSGECFVEFGKDAAELAGSLTAFTQAMILALKLKDFTECAIEVTTCLLKDTDGDGFIDLEDACPNEPGKSFLFGRGGKGCPDSDNDGTPDKFDCCPNEEGFNGGCRNQPPPDCKKGKDGIPPAPKSGDKFSIDAGNSYDPNAKYVSGWGAENISKSRNLAYTITFENLALAAFAAQKVVVTDVLDKTKFNVATFRFLGYGFDKNSFIVDEHQQFFQIIDLRPNIPAKLAVKGFLDETSGTVKWEFTTLDPISLKEIDDDLVGFLPPNQTSPQGEGYVRFAIDVMPNFKTGDIVKNKSSIVFDNNQPIITNEVSAKIDEIAPQSQISLVSISPNKDSVTLSIAGSDIISGIESYHIFRSVNDSSYNFVETTSKTNLAYAIQRGKSYKFYSIAVDNVGNQELPPSVSDVTFSIEGTTKTLNIDNISVTKIYPNPSKNYIDILLNNTSMKDITLKLFNILGAEVKEQIYNGASSLLHLELSDLPNGFYQLYISQKGQFKLVEHVVIQR